MSIFEFKYQNSHWNNIKKYKTVLSKDYYLMIQYAEEVLVDLLTHNKMNAFQFEVGSFDTGSFRTLSSAYPAIITPVDRVELQLDPVRFKHDSNKDEKRDQGGIIEHYVRAYSPIEHVFTEEDVTHVESKMFEGHEWSRQVVTPVKSFKEIPANIVVVSPPLYFIERTYDFCIDQHLDTVLKVQKYNE